MNLEMTVILSASVILVSIGIAWGIHQRQLNEHQRLVDRCDMSKIMTEEKCRNLHNEREERTTVVLAGIQKSLVNLETAIEKLEQSHQTNQVKLATMTERLNNLAQRIESWDKVIDQVHVNG